MTRKKINEITAWSKILGVLPKGTLVRMKPEFRSHWPLLYFAFNPIESSCTIPTKVFIGVVVGKDPHSENSYAIKWIADSSLYSNPLKYFFSWDRNIFEIVGFEKVEELG